MRWAATLQEACYALPAARLEKMGSTERGYLDGQLQRSRTCGDHRRLCGIRCLSSEVARDVDEVVDAQVRGDLAQAGAAGGEETAEHLALAQFLDGSPPGFDWTRALVTGRGSRDLSRGGKSFPQRRATSSSDQVAQPFWRSRPLSKWRLSITENPPIETAKIPANPVHSATVSALIAIAGRTDRRLI